MVTNPLWSTPITLSDPDKECRDTKCAEDDREDAKYAEDDHDREVETDMERMVAIELRDET